MNYLFILINEKIIIINLIYIKIDTISYINMSQTI